MAEGFRSRDSKVWALPWHWARRRERRLRNRGPSRILADHLGRTALNLEVGFGCKLEDDSPGTCLPEHHHLRIEYIENFLVIWILF